MKHRYLSMLRGIMILAASAILGACSGAASSAQSTMADTAAQNQANTTYCLGRFLIDVPAGSTVSGGSYKYRFASIEKPQAMSFEQFTREAAAREVMLRSTKHEKDPSLLRQIQRPDKSAYVLAFWEKVGTAGLITVDGYKWVEGHRFLLRAEASESRQAQAVARMADRLSRLRPRADGEIPQEPGYCFAGGFIANEEWEDEAAAMDFRLADHPDVVVSVDIFPLASHRHDKPLLDRMGGAVQQLGRLATGVSVLRKRERKIGDYEGQEYLAAGPSSGGMRGHMFIWETQGDGTLDTPFISIEFSSGRQDDQGNPQRTRLSDRQAIELWDRIVGSFRLRPVGGAPVKSSAAAPPRLPLGELAASGRTCPESGWWQCIEDALPVQGGRRRFFRTGEVLPQAVLLGEPSMWQRLRGEQPSYRTATAWELVAYEDMVAPPMAPPSPAAHPPADSQPTGGA